MADGAPYARLPVQLLRRKKGIAFLTFVLVCGVYAFLNFDSIAARARSARTRAGRYADHDVLELLTQVPGAVPGSEAEDTLASGRRGAAYPSAGDVSILFLEQVRDPDYTVQDERWAEWAAWLHGGGSDSFKPHLNFLMQLKRLPNGTVDDVRQYLEAPGAWTTKHEARLPLTVFSKSYCPYSRAGKALLDSLGAAYAKFEVDLRGKTLGETC